MQKIVPRTLTAYRRLRSDAVVELRHRCESMSSQTGKSGRTYPRNVDRSQSRSSLEENEEVFAE